MKNNIMNYIIDLLGFTIIFTIIIFICSKIGITNFSIWTIVGGAIGWILSKIIYNIFIKK